MRGAASRKARAAPAASRDDAPSTIKILSMMGAFLSVGERVR